jgi:hypothetical protein
MKVDDLIDAENCARRFLKEAKLCTSINSVNQTHRRVDSGPQAAATKRASMDLTRALAKLRRPG